MFQVFAHTKHNASTPEAFATLRAAFNRYGITGKIRVATTHGLTTVDPSSDIFVRLERPTLPEAFEAAHTAMLEVFPDAIRMGMDDFVQIPVQRLGE